MIEWIAAISLVLGFVILVKILGLVGKARNAVNLSRDSFGILRDPDMTDEAKESALRGLSLRLLWLSLLLAIGGAIAVCIPIFAVWLLSLVNIVSFESVLTVATSVRFLLLSGILGGLACFLGVKLRGDASRYSALDRLMHDVAFATYTAHIPIADAETRFLRKQLVSCKPARPVFITALPRAGTTLLLECCANLPEFATHCYRDMPFVLTPWMWERFSSAFYRHSGALKQRAHEDGMLINLDSPEALEEVLWKTFWRRHYRRDCITPWSASTDTDPEFLSFFRDHMRKIILLRCGVGNGDVRYISKNNANIGRIQWLSKSFKDATIIIPFRDPLQHAASLLRQHKNFMEIHAQDRFAARYMQAIGHFEFGRNLRPINFGNWLQTSGVSDTETLDFWLAYWVATYSHLLKEDVGAVSFLHYDRLCNDPKHGLAALGRALGIRRPEELLAASSKIRPVRLLNVNAGAVCPSLLQESDHVYAALKERAVNHGKVAD